MGVIPYSDGAGGVLFDPDVPGLLQHLPGDLPDQPGRMSHLQTGSRAMGGEAAMNERTRTAFLTVAISLLCAFAGIFILNRRTDRLERRLNDSAQGGMAYPIGPMSVPREVAESTSPVSDEMPVLNKDDHFFCSDCSVDAICSPGKPCR